MSLRPLRFFASVVGLLLVLLSPLLAQRQMEALGRGVVAVRPNDTQVYVGWRLLGDDPSGIAFNLYRSVNGAAATKINPSPLSASTNYLDTPGSTALAGTIAYHVVPVLNGVEQTPSAPYLLTTSTAAYQQFISLPLATTHPNPASSYPYNVKFCWVGDFDGDGEYDFLVDRVPTNPDASERQYLEAYKRDGTFLWRMDMGPNSVEQYAYEPGSSAISIGDSDNLTVYDLDGDGRAEVAVRTSNGVTVTNAAGQVVATIAAASDSDQFVSIIDGLSGAELGRAPLPNPWAQHGTLTNKCAVAYLDGVRPSVLFYGYNREDGGAFRRVFTTFDYREGAVTQRWTLPQTFAGAEGHQIRVADVDNDGKDEIIEIGHVIDDDGTQLFVIPEISHGDRFHVADMDPDRPGLENFIIQQYNPSFLTTAYFDAGTGDMIKKWYATTTVDVGRGLAGDLTAAHKGYEFFSTQPGIFNSKGEQIYANSFFPYEGLWWDADLLREFIAAADGNGYNPIINKFNPSTGGNDRLWSIYSDFGSFVNRTAYGGRPAFWGDILGDWREELVFVTSDFASIRIYTPTTTATNRLYTLMHNPAYRMQATTKGYVQASNVDYYLGVGMTSPPPPPMVRSDLVWSGGPSASTWDSGVTTAWINTTSSAASPFTAGQSVRFDLSGNHTTAVTLSGSLQPTEVSVYSPGDYTFSGTGSLSGAMPLVKAGPGSLTLSGSHAYTGPTTIWDGALRVNGVLSGSPVTIWGGTWGGALAEGLSGGRLAGSGTVSQSVILAYRGAITPGAGMGSAGTLTLGAGLTAADGTTLAFDLSSDPTGVNQANDRLAITGNLALSGTVTVFVNALASSLPPGTYTLLTYTGALTGSASNLAVVLPEGTPYTVALGSGSLTLTVPVTRAPAAVTWTGSASGVWDIANTLNWSLSGSPTPFVSGDTLAFDATGAARPAITLNTTASVAGATFSGTTNYTVSGSGAIAGSGGLTKSGASTVTLNTANTYTGPTTLSGGVLAVSALADGDLPSAIGASSSDAANLVFNGGTLRLTGSQTNTNRAMTLGASGGTLDTPSATLQISGAITGSGALTKTGAGTLILASANTHAGGTILQSGTLVLASDTANTSGLGSGGITLQGGTLRMYNNTSSYNTSTWAINVPSGATARFEADGRSNLNTPLTGAGTLNFYTTFSRTNLQGNWSAFTGRLNVTADADGGDFRLANSAGLPNAWVDLGANVYAYSRAGSGTTTLNLGALSGVASAVLNAGGGSSEGVNQPVRWQIGGLGLDSTFAGRFTGTSLLTKVGAGTLTLTGASTHTGATTISAGTLLLTGSFSGSAVSVQSGGGLGGSGSITGNVAFASGSRLVAGLSASPLAITGDLALNGAITVASAAPAAGTYPLITYTGALTGTPSFIWSGNGYAATFDSSTPGRINVTLVETIGAPTEVVAVGGDARVALSWSPSEDAATYTVLRATTLYGAYSAVATDLVGTTHLDTTGLLNGRTYFYIVRAVAANSDSADSAPASASVGPLLPRANWRFDQDTGSTALDSSGNGWHAALAESPAWINPGRLDQAINLPGTAGQHLLLPANITVGLQDFTLSAWVRMNALTNWARLVDIGTGTNNYLFIAPRTTTNFLRFAIRTPSTGEQIITSSVATPVGSWFHVAVTLSGTTGTLYLNGQVVGTNTAMTLTPDSLGATTLNYVGRSQFTADTYLNGAIDELQLYSRALSPAELATLVAPPAAPADLAATASETQATLNWSPVASATGYTVKRAATAAGPFLNLAVNQPATTYTDTGLETGTTYHYVVTALQTVAESALSSPVSATPLPPAPAAPTGLAANAGDTQVALSWSASDDAISYTVLRSTTSGSGYDQVATDLASTTYTDTGLTNGTAYHYVVTAANTGGTSPFSNQASATPVSPFTPIESWRVIHFGSPASTGDAANDADPDADGAVNLLEYALGGDPWLGDASAILPTIAIASDRLALTFHRVADPSLTYSVQASSDLTAAWAGVWSSTGEANTDAPVTVPDTEPLSAHPRRFLRLEVTAP